MENNWRVVRYGEWSENHGMYEEIREHEDFAEEFAVDHVMMNSSTPMYAYRFAALSCCQNTRLILN